MKKPRIRNRWFIFLFSAFVLIFSNSAFGFTKEQEDDIRKGAANFEYHTVTTKEGLNFRVPEDMPIETKNGIQAPLPFDEYMYGKFKQIENRLNSMDAKLDRIETMFVSLKENKAKC